MGQTSEHQVTTNETLTNIFFLKSNVKSKMFVWGLSFALFAFCFVQGEVSRNAAVMQALQANDGVGDDIVKPLSRFFSREFQRETTKSSSWLSLVEELAKFLNQTDQRQASMEEELRSLKNKVATKASASEVSSLKTKVSNLAADQIRCESGYTVVGDIKLKTFTTKKFGQAFKSTPAFMMAVYRAKLTGKEFDLGYFVTPSYFEYFLASQSSTSIDAAWIACGK